MKRKRFMRLVMSYDIQKNEAARIAARVGAFGSYEVLFRIYHPWLAGHVVTKGLQRGLRDFSATVNFAARRLCDFSAAAFGWNDITQEEHEAAEEAANTQ